MYYSVEKYIGMSFLNSSLIFMDILSLASMFWFKLPLMSYVRPYLETSVFCSFGLKNLTSFNLFFFHISRREKMPYTMKILKTFIGHMK